MLCRSETTPKFSLVSRPTDRTSDDLDTIFSKLKDVKAFEKFHPLLIQQLCYYSYFENLEKGVTRKCIVSINSSCEEIFLSFSETVFRTGDLGANWFAILSGSVDVCVPAENGKVRTSVPLSCRRKKCERLVSLLRVTHWFVRSRQAQPLGNRFSTIRLAMPPLSPRRSSCYWELNRKISRYFGR